MTTPDKPKRGCMIPGCERRHWAKGLCRLHGERLRRNAEKFSFATGTVDKPTECQVTGCGRKHQAKGLCKLHNDRHLRGGGAFNRVTGEIENPTHCEIEGCDRKRYAKGMCVMHYSRARNAPEKLHARRFYNRFVLTPARAEAMVKLYGIFQSVKEVAREMGCTIGIVRRVLRDAGVETRSQAEVNHRNREAQKRAVRDRLLPYVNTDLSYPAIAKKVGLHTNTVSRHFRAMGLARSPREAGERSSADRHAAAVEQRRRLMPDLVRWRNAGASFTRIAALVEEHYGESVTAGQLSHWFRIRRGKEPTRRQARRER